MAPYTFHLISTSNSEEASTIKLLWSLRPKPLTVGKAHYFLSASDLSPTLQNDPETSTSPFNLVAVLAGASTSIPVSIAALTTKVWSFTADVGDEWTTNYAERNSAFLHVGGDPIPPFPLEPSTAPDPNEEEVELPLTKPLRTFLANFSAKYSGPVTMFNFLSFYEGMFPQYQRYIEAFSETLVPAYGAAPRMLGSMVKSEGGEAAEKWDMIGWVQYPGAANFGRMLEGGTYKELDRKYKKGVVKDNPILLIVELEA